MNESNSSATSSIQQVKGTFGPAPTPERDRSAARPNEPALEDLQFHPKRDVFSRRLWRDSFRRIARIAFLLIGDAIAVATAVYVADRLTMPADPAWPALVPLAVVSVVAVEGLLGTYGPNRDRRRYLQAFLGALLGIGAMVGLGALYEFPTLPSAGHLICALGGAVLVTGVRGLADFGVREIYRRGWNRKPTLVVGRTEDVWEILERLQESDERRTRVVGHLSPEAGQDPVALGGVDQLSETLEQHEVENVIISAHLDPGHLEELILECFSRGVSVSVVPRTLSRIPSRASSSDILGWPMVQMKLPRLHLTQVTLKRTLDFVGALTGVVLFAPLGLLIGLAIKLDSPGPVFFRQRRLGVGGRPFTILKFRTMKEDAEQLLWSRPELQRKYRENDFKLPPGEDPRITKLGRFLRSSSLDELPQLINVLKGDMSLVGPRPIVPEEIEHYGEQSALFLGVRPGITGPWQVNGRSDVCYPERAELDIRYIKQWSLGEDLRILFHTVPAVLKSHGAH